MCHLPCVMIILYLHFSYLLAHLYHCLPCTIVGSAIIFEGPAIWTWMWLHHVPEK